MGWAGLGRLVESSITPHVTLFYNEEGPETFPIEPVTWTVGEVVLVHSLIGRATHVPLARFPLIG
jgi:2'-5' RNA ligase